MIEIVCNLTKLACNINRSYDTKQISNGIIHDIRFYLMIAELFFTVVINCTSVKSFLSINVCSIETFSVINSKIFFVIILDSSAGLRPATECSLQSLTMSFCHALCGSKSECRKLYSHFIRSCQSSSYSYSI